MGGPHPLRHSKRPPPVTFVMHYRKHWNNWGKELDLDWG